MRTIRFPYSEFEKTPTPVGTKSMTKQSFKDECDVNTILAQYQNTGVITHLNSRQLEYLDNTTHDNYHSSINLVLEAQNAFDQLPAKVRKRFENEPAKLLEFMADPANYKEAVELGLATPPPEAPSGDPDPPSQTDEKPPVE